MKKSMSPIVTGLATGAVLGTAVYMYTNHSKSHNNTARTLKRNTGKALKTVGNIMENLSYMMK